MLSGGSSLACIPFQTRPSCGKGIRNWDQEYSGPKIAYLETMNPFSLCARDESGPLGDSLAVGSGRAGQR